eukprot:5053007-Prymnesium_polylepis.1
MASLRGCHVSILVREKVQQHFFHSKHATSAFPGLQSSTFAFQVDRATLSGTRGLPKFGGSRERQSVRESQSVTKGQDEPCSSPINHRVPIE